MLELRANAPVERVLVEGGRGDRGRVRRRAGERPCRSAKAVVVAGGALNTPQLLMRSGLEHAARSGGTSGLHPVRLVYGLFDEPQDAHMVYPITAHCMEHQHDEDGGFVIEASTIQDPIAFATTLARRGRAALGAAPRRGGAQVPPLERRARDGERREHRVRGRRRGRSASASTSTFSAARARPASTRRSSSARRCSRPRARRRSAGRASCPPTCRAAAGWATTPSARPSTATAESHDVEAASSSATPRSIPRTLSVNPSLTIMALATRLAEHLDAIRRATCARSRPSPWAA